MNYNVIRVLESRERERERDRGRQNEESVGETVKILAFLLLKVVYAIDGAVIGVCYCRCCHRHSHHIFNVDIILLLNISRSFLTHAPTGKQRDSLLLTQLRFRRITTLSCSTHFYLYF